MKRMLLFAAILLLLCGCSQGFAASEYLSKEEYVAARRDWTAQELKPQSYGDQYGLSIYTHNIGATVEYSPDPPEEGRLYLFDSAAKEATLFLDEKVSFWGYLKEWIVCVVNDKTFVVVDAQGEHRQTLFLAQEPVRGLWCDGEAFHYLSGDSIWRYNPGQPAPEAVVTFPGIEYFNLVSNLEYTWFAPTEAYLSFVAQAEAQGMDSDALYYALGSHELLGPGHYYTDVRVGTVYQQQPFDPLAIVWSDPPWYEAHRTD